MVKEESPQLLARQGKKGARLVDNGDGTVTDKKAGLMWQKEDDGEERNLQEALTYCKKLFLAGFKDWRLPTLAEFEGLEEAAEESDIDMPIRYPRNGYDYWTSTLPPPWSGFPKTVAYVASGTTYYSTNKYYVRAVRDQK